MTGEEKMLFEQILNCIKVSYEEIDTNLLECYDMEIDSSETNSWVIKKERERQLPQALDLVTWHKINERFLRPVPIFQF